MAEKIISSGASTAVRVGGGRGVRGAAAASALCARISAHFGESELARGRPISHFCRPATRAPAPGGLRWLAGWSLGRSVLARRQPPRALFPPLLTKAVLAVRLLACWAAIASRICFTLFPHLSPASPGIGLPHRRRRSTPTRATNAARFPLCSPLWPNGAAFRQIQALFRCALRFVVYFSLSLIVLRAASRRISSRKEAIFHFALLIYEMCADGTQFPLSARPDGAGCGLACARSPGPRMQRASQGSCYILRRPALPPQCSEGRRTYCARAIVGTRETARRCLCNHGRSARLPCVSGGIQGRRIWSRPYFASRRVK